MFLPTAHLSSPNQTSVRGLTSFLPQSCLGGRGTSASVLADEGVDTDHSTEHNRRMQDGLLFLNTLNAFLETSKLTRA